VVQWTVLLCVMLVSTVRGVCFEEFTGTRCDEEAFRDRTCHENDACVTDGVHSARIDCDELDSTSAWEYGIYLDTTTCSKFVPDARYTGSGTRCFIMDEFSLSGFIDCGASSAMALYPSGGLIFSLATWWVCR